MAQQRESNVVLWQIINACGDRWQITKHCVDYKNKRRGTKHY